MVLADHCLFLLTFMLMQNGEETSKSVFFWSYFHVEYSMSSVEKLC